MSTAATDLTQQTNIANNVKDWTIMIYMSGDNNLSLDMVYALQKIRDIANKNKSELNLLVYYDGYSPAIPTLYCDFSDFNPEQKLNDQKLYFRSYAVENKLYEVDKEFDEDSALKYSVVNFINWCIETQNRKATNYGLIFSGHSFGFQSIGMLKDDSSDHTMSMEDIDWILERVTKSKTDLDNEYAINETEKLVQAKNDEISAVKETIKTLNSEVKKDEVSLSKKSAELKTLEKKLDILKKSNQVILGKKLGILGFDSCVMSMLEVGNQFKEYSETMVASEGSVPNAGWSYAEILKEIKIKSESDSRVMNAKELAETFVRNFIEEQDRYAIGGSSVDLAAWDLSELDALNLSFKILCRDILDCFAEEDNKLYKQMKRVILQVRKDCQSYMFEQCIDLGDFCELLISEIKSLKTELNDSLLNKKLDSLSQSCKSVLNKLEKCILLGGFSGGKYQFSNGISVFFPWSASAYGVSAKDYENLRFTQKEQAGEKWKEFLIKYIGKISYRDSIKKQAGKEKRFHYSYANSEFNKLINNSKSNENNGDSNENNGESTASFKIPDNPASKIPDNPASKLMGGTERYLQYFMKFDNIEIPWNISGYTKDQNEGASVRTTLSTEPPKPMPQMPPINMVEYPNEDESNDSGGSSA